MDEIPPGLLAVLPPNSAPAARDWWAGLAVGDRERLAGLWDERLEVRFFAPQDGDGWDHVPAAEGGRFAPREGDRRVESQHGFFERVLEDPSLVLLYEPIHRTFHIGCTRHAAARECLATRSIPNGFRCPVGATSCPLGALRGAYLTAVMTPVPPSPAT